MPYQTGAWQNNLLTALKDRKLSFTSINYQNCTYFGFYYIIKLKKRDKKQMKMKNYIILSALGASHTIWTKKQ